MNLHRMLRARAEAGRPVRVGLIGAGKFGTMFLAQARRTPGLQVMAVADLAPARADAALARAGWAEEERRARSFATALRGRRHARGRRCVRADRGRRARRGDRRDRASGRRHRPCTGLLRRRPPRGDGECRGRCARRAAARQGGGGGRRGLFARLWRPAGADRRDGGLGAGRGPRCRRRRQGDPLSAGLPSRDAGRCLDPLRAHAGGGGGRRHEPADVQLLPRRHQVGDRDGRRRQRHRD